jgi:hypothetical protein
MNDLSEQDLKSIEHIRETYAQLDPVPHDVLAAARRALGWGLPVMPFSPATSPAASGLPTRLPTRFECLPRWVLSVTSIGR